MCNTHFPPGTLPHQWHNCQHHHHQKKNWSKFDDPDWFYDIEVSWEAILVTQTTFLHTRIIPCSLYHNHYHIIIITIAINTTITIIMIFIYIIMMIKIMIITMITMMIINIMMIMKRGERRVCLLAISSWWLPKSSP